jgi:hypothetical protein
MARIRTIKPEFWKHEDLSELPAETHMLAAALLNYSDDEGYFKANPKLVKAECCPLRDDSTNVRRMLEQLVSIGYIRLFFGTDGKEYGHVAQFLKHQRVDRPKDSEIKALEDSTNNRRIIDEPSSPEGKGREGKGTGNGNTNPDGLVVGTDVPPTEPPNSKIDKNPPCPRQEIIELFAKHSPSLIQPRLVTDSVKEAISSRWRQSPRHQSLEFWQKYFDYCESLDFLAGRKTPTQGGKPFRVGLEWIVKAENFAKIINGNYANE